MTRLSLEVSERAQAELQRKNERLKLVLDISQSVASTLDLRQLCRLISSSIRPVLQCDAAMLALPEPDNTRLRVYGLDFPDSKGYLQDDMLIPIERTPPGNAIRTGKASVVDFRELAPFCPPQAEGLQSGCALPLISRGRVLGTLNLARLRKDAFSDADVEFLTQVASQIAIAVENALAYVCRGMQAIAVEKCGTQFRCEHLAYRALARAGNAHYADDRCAHEAFSATS